MTCAFVITRADPSAGSTSIITPDPSSTSVSIRTTPGRARPMTSAADGDGTGVGVSGGASTGVAVGVGVGVGEGGTVGVAVGTGVGRLVGVGEGAAVGEGALTGVGEAAGVGEGAGSGVGTAVGTAVGDGTAVGSAAYVAATAAATMASRSGVGSGIASSLGAGEHAATTSSRNAALAPRHHAEFRPAGRMRECPSPIQHLQVRAVAYGATSVGASGEKPKPGGRGADCPLRGSSRRAAVRRSTSTDRRTKRGPGNHPGLVFSQRSWRPALSLATPRTRRRGLRRQRR